MCSKHGAKRGQAPFLGNGNWETGDTRTPRTDYRNPIRGTGIVRISVIDQVFTRTLEAVLS